MAGCKDYMLILLFLLVFSLVFLSAALIRQCGLEKQGGREKQGGLEKRYILPPFVNKPYKKSKLPSVDYDLPALYEQMNIKDPWEVWPNVFRPF